MAPEIEDGFVTGLRALTRPYSERTFLELNKAVITVATERAHWTPEGQLVLTRRSPTDRVWPNLYHLQGSVMLKGDTEADALRRAGKEIGTQDLPAVFIDRVHFPHGNDPHENPRGQEIGLLFGTRLPRGFVLPPDTLLAFPSELPDDMIPFHRILVTRAMQWWVQI